MKSCANLDFTTSLHQQQLRGWENGVERDIRRPLIGFEDTRSWLRREASRPRDDLGGGGKSRIWLGLGLGTWLIWECMLVGKSVGKSTFYIDSKSNCLILLWFLIHNFKELVANIIISASMIKKHFILKKCTLYEVFLMSHILMGFVCITFHNSVAR